MHPTLAKEEIIKLFKKNFNFKVPDIYISKKTQSTNEDAKKNLVKLDSNLSVHLTEQQLAGKGRNGKEWVSPKEKNIYLSIGWNSELDYSELEGLSLVIGTCVAKTLNTFSKYPIQIKWPNDLIVNKKKLCGILIETQDIGGKAGVVIGIGINVHMTQEEGKNINQNWVSLDELSKTKNNRNHLIADLIGEIHKALDHFKKVGFSYFKKDYEAMDCLKGKKCTVIQEGSEKIVNVFGVNDNGELLIEDNSKYMALRYGEVSIREL